MTKSEIRKAVLADLKKIVDRDERSRILERTFLSLPIVAAADSVALFMSANTEPDTSGILGKLLLSDKKVFLPRVEGDEMVFVQVVENTSFSVGAFGIKEPIGEPAEPSFDVMAVPLVAFDDNGNRLGHGKGYYDRYLQKHPCYTVGLAFSEQKKDVPADPWDVKLSIILNA